MSLQTRPLEVSVFRRAASACFCEAMRSKNYRVRARNARIRVMRRTTLTSTCKNEAIEPRIVVIIIRNFGGMFSRHAQQIFAM